MNILVTGARAPIAADIAKALAICGHKVWLADSFFFPVSAASPFIQGYLRLPPPRSEFDLFVSELATICVSNEVDAIIPTSEDVFWLAGAVTSIPYFVNVRTSPLPVLALLHHKGTFARLAASLGYGASENFEIVRPSDLFKIYEPTRYVFKPIYSRFATRTLIRPAFQDLLRLQPSPTNPWLAQSFEMGREICSYNVADTGRLLLHVAYEPLYRVGIGASMYFKPVVNEGIRVMSERFIQATGFTGQISFDVLETENGLVALECNPRGVSGVHLAVQQPEVLAASLLGEKMNTVSPILASPRMLLLPLLLNYPTALFRTCDRSMLRAGKDALSSAGISVWAQARALGEISWRAIGLGMNIPLASTVDIEWNGDEGTGEIPQIA